jgi:hypothetical protein
VYAKGPNGYSLLAAGKPPVAREPGTCGVSLSCVIGAERIEMPMDIGGSCGVVDVVVAVHTVRKEKVTSQREHDIEVNKFI